MNHVGGPTLRRRRLLAGSLAGVLTGLAGCSGGDETTERGDTADYLTAEASLLIDIDMSLTESDATRQVLDGYAAEEESLVETFEERTGLEPESVREVLAFADETQPERTTLVVDADASESDAVSGLETAHDTDYRRVDHEVGALHEPNDSEAPALGVAATGQFLFGSESEVRTALDVFFDREGELDGRLRDAFEADREGTAVDLGEVDPEERTQYVLAATDNPRSYLPADGSDEVPAGVSLDIFTTVDTVTAGYFVAGDDVGVDLVMRTSDETIAEEIADFTAAILTFLRSDVDDAVAEELQRVAVDREADVVTVAYRSDFEGAARLAAALAAAF